MPWHRAPRCQGLTRPPAKFFYHITFYNTGVSEHEEWIGLFYRIATVLTRSPASAGIANRPLVFMGIFLIFDSNTPTWSVENQLHY